MSIPLVIDMSGYAYDVNNPTQYTERLSYALYQILDSLEVAGYSFDHSSSLDLQAVEADLAQMQTAFNAQEIGGAVVDYPGAGTEAYSSKLLYATFCAVRGRIAALSSERNKQLLPSNFDLPALITCLQNDIAQAIWGVAKSEGIVTIGTVDVWTKSQVVEEFH